MSLIDRGADALMLEGSEAGGHIGPVALVGADPADSFPDRPCAGVHRRRNCHRSHDGPPADDGGGGHPDGHPLCSVGRVRRSPQFQGGLRTGTGAGRRRDPAVRQPPARDPGAGFKNEGTIEFAKLQLELMHKLENNIIDREEAQFEVERFWVGALRRAAVDGEVAKGSLMAGQSVGLVREIKPLKTIMEEMVTEAEAEMQWLKRLFTEAPADRL